MDSVANKNSKQSKRSKNKSNNKKFRKEFIIIGAVLLVVVAIYLIGSLYFNQKFLNNTFINGVDVSAMTIDKANSELADLVDDYTLELKFNDGNTESILGTECGVAYNEDNNVANILKKQSPFAWVNALFGKSNNTVENLAKVDETVLREKLGSLAHLQADAQVAPVDARVEYANNQFNIVDEVYGSTINVDKLVSEIVAAFSEGNATLDLTEKGCYVEPGVKAADASIQQLYETAQNYASASITYNTKSGDVVLDGSTLITWLSIDENGNYYRDDNVFKEKATEFVSSLAKKINDVGGKRTFTGANGRTITVSGGSYGVRLQNSKEVSGLLEDIYANKVTTRTPITSGGDPSGVNGGLGDTFVEVDLSSQHMWYHKNGTILLESDIVSGTYNDPSRRTPAGVYSLYSKERNRTLRGAKKADGTYEYETPVSYWMPFNGGIGLHDSSSWRSKWGGDIYLNNGSHGCINLPTGVAGQLYQNIEVGCPVVCYY